MKRFVLMLLVGLMFQVCVRATEYVPSIEPVETFAAANEFVPDTEPEPDSDADELADIDIAPVFCAAPAVQCGPLGCFPVDQSPAAPASCPTCPMQSTIPVQGPPRAASAAGPIRGLFARIRDRAANRRANRQANRQAAANGRASIFGAGRARAACGGC